MAGQTQRVEFMKDIPDDQDRRFAMFSNCFLGKGPATKSDDFLEKFQKGGGVIFNPKIYGADFGKFKQGFLNMKLIQKD